MRLSRIVYLIFSSLISIITINIGIIIIKQTRENLPIGIFAILLGFLVLYLSFYIEQIKDNQDEIRKIKKRMAQIKQNEEVKEKLLNTIKDIIILKKIKG